MSSKLELLSAYDAGRSREHLVTLRYLLLDVFAARALEGNPLAVFPDARAVAPAIMGPLARELNLSETVFLLPAKGQGDLRARIFTPSAELPFAGHPVLGAGVLAASALGLERVTLETGAGPVAVTLEGPGEGIVRSGRMEQPLPTCAPYAREAELLAALGVERSGLPVESYCNGPTHVYVALSGGAELAALRPDLTALTSLGEITVSCFAASGGLWRSRVFAPGLGVAEDPATGSAAGPLAVHLARHGLVAYGEQIEIVQGVEIGRPSVLRARADGGRQRLDAVEVAGDAVLVGEGSFALPAGDPRAPR